MNLDWWNLFYEVAISKSISKASKKLNISQPAITNQIKKLEEHLNCKLFFRSQKGVFLTPAGELIFNDIKNGLNAFDMAEKKLTDNTKNLKTTIRIGISTTLTKTYLMKYIKAFHKKYNEVIFEISTDPTMMLKEELKKGKIDFIVAKFPFKINDEFSYIKIGEMQDIFIINKDYKELINKSINIKELINYPILIQKKPSSSREYFETFCEKNKIKLHSVMEISSSNLLIEFTKIGYGIGVVTKQYVKKELENHELFELITTPTFPKRDFGIIALKNDYLSKGSHLFIETLLKKEKK